MSSKTTRNTNSHKKQPHGKILREPEQDDIVSVPMHTIGKILAQNLQAKLTLEPDGKGFFLIPLRELMKYYKLRIPMQNVIILGAREESSDYRPVSPPGPPPESPPIEEDRGSDDK